MILTLKSGCMLGVDEKIARGQPSFWLDSFSWKIRFWKLESPSVVRLLLCNWSLGIFCLILKINLSKEEDYFEGKIFHEIEILNPGFIYAQWRSYEHPASSFKRTVATYFDHYPVLIYRISSHGRLITKNFKCRGFESRVYRQVVYRVLDPPPLLCWEL